MDSLEADIKRLSDYKHKLRTFSHQILGYTELVLEDAESAQEQQFLTDLQKVHSGGEKLLSQIGEYLDQERLESGKFDLEMFRIDLSGILDLIVGYVDFILEDSKEEVIANYKDDLKKIKGVIASMMESLRILTHSVILELKWRAMMRDSKLSFLSRRMTQPRRRRLQRAQNLNQKRQTKPSPFSSSMMTK